MGELKSILVEHACGHIVTANVWDDEVKRKRQLPRLESAPCTACLTAGWKPALTPTPSLGEPAKPPTNERGKR